jgi:hypothetical protein
MMGCAALRGATIRFRLSYAQALRGLNLNVGYGARVDASAFAHILEPETLIS